MTMKEVRELIEKFKTSPDRRWDFPTFVLLKQYGSVAFVPRHPDLYEPVH